LIARQPKNFKMRRIKGRQRDAGELVELKQEARRASRSKIMKQWAGRRVGNGTRYGRSSRAVAHAGLCLFQQSRAKAQSRLVPTPERSAFAHPKDSLNHFPAANPE
jgi:hypothetical protein